MDTSQLSWTSPGLKRKATSGITDEEDGPRSRNYTLESAGSTSGVIPSAASSSPKYPKTFRVRGPFDSSDPLQLKKILEECLGPDCFPKIYSLAAEYDDRDSVATVSFEQVPPSLKDADQTTFSDQDVTIDSHFRGLTTLFRPKESEHELDIIAISGLGGHAFGSFKERAGTHMWPRDSLPSDFPGVRILSYGHDSRVHGSTSFQTIEDLASSLRNHVEGLLRQAGPPRMKPIVFIAHSLGGLLLKEALIQSGIANTLLISNTCGILFFGVPNHGMKIEHLRAMAENQPNLGLIHSLDSESELLRKQSREFPKIFNSQETQIFCFFELRTSPTPKEVDGKWQAEGGPEVILVSSVSATHCRPWEDAAHQIQGIVKNHSELVKFTKRDDEYTKVRNILREIIAHTTHIQSAKSPQLDSFTQECLQALLLTRPQDEMDRIESTKDMLLEDCCSWVFADEHFKALKNDSQLLWVSGDPGKGKTMLMISIIRKLQQEHSHGLTFFFCQSTDNNLNTAASVLRGLLWTLINSLPRFGSFLHDDYKTMGKQAFTGQNSFFRLRAILNSILRDPELPITYLLVDALDECDFERHHLLEFITAAADASPNVKWIVSSRNITDIKEKLSRDSDVLSLELNANHIARSVSFFIDTKVQWLKQIRHYHDELAEEVRFRLSEKSQSTFLWVALVCKELEDVNSYDAIQVIEEMPAGLPLLYERIMGHIQALKRRDPKFCIQVLTTLIIVFRPLRILELGQLAGLPNDIAREELHLRRIIQKCGSFLTLRDDTIYFVHQSAKDYLVNKVSEEAGISSSFFSPIPREEHLRLLNHSLDAMSGTLKRNICSLPSAGTAATCANRTSALDGIEYACLYWVDHFELYCEGQGRLSPSNRVHLDGTVDTIYKFLLKFLLNWIEALSIYKRLGMGIKALQQLRTTTECNGTPLEAFVKDAIRVLLYFRPAIEDAPLQIYHSALIYSPVNSIVKRAFGKQYQRIDLAPHLENDWSPLLQIFECEYAFNAVKFSPSGNLLASSNQNHLYLWDAHTGERLHMLNLQLDPQNLHWLDNSQLSFSLDGKKILWRSYYGGCMRLWEIETGQLIQNFDNQDIIAWTSENTLLASVSVDSNYHPIPDGIIQIWYGETGKFKQKLEGKALAISCLKFSRDGDLLASAAADGSIEIWDIFTGTLRHTLSLHVQPIKVLAFSAGGQRLASADDCVALLWDLETGAYVCTLVESSSSIRILHFTIRDQVLLATKIGQIELWDAQRGVQLHAITGGQYRVRYSVIPPYSSFFAFADETSLSIWNLTSGFSLQTFVLPGIRRMKFFRDGKRLLVAFKMYQQLWNIESGTLLCTLHFGEQLLHTSTLLNFHDPVVTALHVNDHFCLQIREGATGRLLRSLYGHTGSITDTVFSPGGMRLASTARDNTIRIWDLETRPSGSVAGSRLPRSLRNKATLIVSSDGKRSITSSMHNTLKLWDGETGRLIRDYQNGEPVISIALSPDNSQFIWSSKLDNISHFLCTTNTEFSMFQLENLESHIRPRFSPDGMQIVGASADGFLYLYANDGVPKLNSIIKAYEVAITSVAFSFDGKQLAIGSEHGHVGTWDVDTGAPLQSFRGYNTATAYASRLSADGTRQILHSPNNEIHMWDCEAGQRLCVLRVPDGHPFFILSNDNKFLASSNSIRSNIVILDCISGQAVHFLGKNSHDGSFDMITFSPCNTMLASVSGNGTIYIWIVDSGALFRTIRLTFPFEDVSYLLFSPDSEKILCVTSSKEHESMIQSWSVKTGIAGLKMELVSCNDRCIRFSPDSRWFSVLAPDGRLQLHELETGNLLRTFVSQAGFLETVRFSPNGRFLVSISWEGTTHIWASESGAILYTLRSFDRHMLGMELRFSLDSQLLATFSEKSAMLKLWNLESGELIHSLDTNFTGIQAVSFLPGGRRLSICPTDGLSQVWELETGKLIRSFEGHTDEVRGLAFSHNGYKLSSFSHDSTLRFWDCQEGAALRKINYRGEGQNACFTPDDRSLAIYIRGQANGRIEIFQVDTGTKIHEVEIPRLNCPTFKFSYNSSELITSFGVYKLVEATTESGSFLQSLGYGIDSKGEWITFNGERAMWIPKDYRPNAIEVRGRRIFITCVSGRFYILNFGDSMSGLV